MFECCIRIRGFFFVFFFSWVVFFGGGDAGWGVGGGILGIVVFRYVICIVEFIVGYVYLNVGK